MPSEPKLDPKLLDDMLRFGRNVMSAPNMISTPDKIKLNVTPYDVVADIDKTRLLRYRPLVKNRHATPLLITYAVINRFHIFDIHPEKSWVRNLLQRGFDVYMLDWGTPTNMDKYLDFDDYVNGYMDYYVEYLKNKHSVDSISIQGYCTGGTIATIYASLYPENVKNYVATAPVIDGWKDTTVISNLAKHVDVDRLVETIGNMPPEFMYYCFSVLKPFEQGVEKYVNFFKNMDNKRFVDNFLRVEKWLGDTPPIPGELFRQWIKYIYQDNLLIQNKMYVGGTRIDLKNITMPVFVQIAVGDHLVSPECSMSLYPAVGSDDKTMRIYPTGHVGMISSSLSQNRVLPELGTWLAERS